jgi:hypothetical protein
MRYEKFFRVCLAADRLDQVTIFIYIFDILNIDGFSLLELPIIPPSCLLTQLPLLPLLSSCALKDLPLAIMWQTSCTYDLISPSSWRPHPDKTLTFANVRS